MARLALVVVDHAEHGLSARLGRATDVMRERRGELYLKRSSVADEERQKAAQKHEEPELESVQAWKERYAFVFLHEKYHGRKRENSKQVRVEI